jgi:prefoldin subunit 5
LGSHHIASGEVQYTLGLFEFFLLGNEMTAELFVSSAYKIYASKLGTEHKSSQDVRTMLAAIRQTVETFEAEAEVPGPN